MRLRSDSLQPGQPIAATYAMGQADGFGGNRNPHLAWDAVPAGTQSFVLLCVDPDVPTVAEMVGRDDVQIPVEQPRTEFVHWVAVDLPADLREIAEGSASDGVVGKGKQQPPGLAGARQGLNSYTDWFAGDAAMGGDYYGYDGPYPPANDRRVHRYFFRLFALDVARLDVPARFTAADALRAMQGHVLAEASLHGTYSLNPAAK
ncbi:YbhB/YbcL family Raf kinase inhibitor-like protein [Xanthomonas rydalmerensis]|uniref:YbhB/YbcL family Raf kinase inhibitor-like protein n=1 Tax=Xanthomonas rydalmerensis TaxID=3046274 RepID=A0ABZ0JMP4_9XANT|nr:YbhB/YbcL family Raf kinase inhibitor-like protein [Xanthomonas sp. DM-2023]WOS41082.1 YbhB/YbcL family Raf kinase inhibitor-like protein [Xanthomonas sp. DM-2023]WOS45267.1 YbhB/YbcL family Raf kinase inhibitor-like protein [Xanthomonas sp. DM-2023]WOS49446.1 YbhB/YbcL family Raf kinase inhibitor-like protein [Xanthomonas sp. DM-2023]WOS53626.1 YbhB/YbcL family Raf kinase inhibitor-like protein [Xanthomonas sp. DM-2023]WOS57809.1 YbhB/YbcL family Raf kinase inhibitor-like protein [Xanthomo